ncbi:hypothetical protein EVU91_13185 [Macrococcoides bohemicum]|uniref:hypothetical protein n=1 Tax=Macrococcoides bohemicum TaxID=1903056 RepID=UPI0010594731|nr:hypothetical protein [Macrococcus bohemicus]TDL33462.1 hypothetical protein EVU91_13185 [Macrococcus bohemicus]
MKVLQKYYKNIFIFDFNKTINDIPSDFIFLNSLNKLEIEFDIIDISTPSTTHINVLKSILSKKIIFKKIIIEKPLFSSQDEYNLLLSIFDSYKGLKNKIYVNEQYYSSKALEKFSRSLNFNTINKISIDMSKNRLLDQINGRFIDSNLEAYGIEIPHILAVLDYLKINLDEITIEENNHYIDKNNYNNQGVSIHFKINNIDIFITSFLGDFYVKGNFKIPNNMNRSLCINEDNSINSSLKFDPVQNVERLYTEIRIKDSINYLFDNLLDNHYRNIIHDKLPNQYSLEKILIINHLLLYLYKHKNTIYLGD